MGNRWIYRLVRMTCIASVANWVRQNKSEVQPLADQSYELLDTGEGAMSMTEKSSSRRFGPSATAEESQKSLFIARTGEADRSVRPLLAFRGRRQAAFFRRYLGEPAPWSGDEILQTYKFTNAYRASDRVSQYLIRNVIYRGSSATHEVFFRTILFKLFNKIEHLGLLKRGVW